MQVEVELVAALLPAKGERLAPGAPAGKRQPQGDEGIQGPDDGDYAEQQNAQLDAETVGNVQAVVQLVEKRHEVLAAQR
ncbi:hypothetical protein D9M69_695210 [compost metagenome]